MTHILIADDHDLVRDTLAAFLRSVEGFEVTTASDMRGVEAALASQSVDITLLDYDMPGMSGLAGLQAVLEKHGNVSFALMSGIATAQVVSRALDMGVKGYFPKSAGAPALIEAIRQMRGGGIYLPEGHVASVRGTDCGLSPRELETLGHLCEGLPNKEIAQIMDLREVTVKLHVKNILAKLNVTNRTRAALKAKELGLV